MIKPLPPSAFIFGNISLLKPMSNYFADPTTSFSFSASPVSALRSLKTGRVLHHGKIMVDIFLIEINYNKNDFLNDSLDKLLFLVLVLTYQRDFYKSKSDPDNLI